MLRTGVTFRILLHLLPLADLCAQQTLDPLSRSTGGVWLREGGDPWAAIDAPAVLAPLKGVRAGVAHFPSAWGLAPLAASAAVAAFPLAGGAAGICLTRFGSPIYAETEAGVSLGMSAGAVRYGVTLRLRHLSIARYGDAWTPRLDFVLAVEAPEWLLWGVRVADANRGGVGRSGERLAQRLAVAAAILPGDLPRLHLQAEAVDGGVDAGAGMSFAFDPLTLRAGSSTPFTGIHAGVEWEAGVLTAGYGIVVHPVLGWSHSFWVSGGGGP